MNRRAVAVLTLALAFPWFSTEAEAQSACEYYRVQKGDSLRDITERAYGDKNYRRIWRANRAEVGRNPNVISVGIVLKLPCLDGSMPEAGGLSEGTRIATESDADTISFVTANGYLPYTDESLEHRGLFTHLVTKAMQRAAPETPVEVAFVNDWAAHVETLLPRQAFDGSFPWTRPGCETQGMLSTVELYACQNFVYSDPFYEIVDGFFSKAGTGFENVIDPVGFAGTTICRPEGYPTGHLDELGLMTDEVTLVQPETTYACFEQLMSGKVDLVALDTRAAERVLMDLGLNNKVLENPHVVSIQPLRVALHKDNPKSDTIIKTLNTGLGIMLQSGEWASIVTEGLRDQAPLVN